MAWWPVSAQVGNVKNNDASLIEPVAPIWRPSRMAVGALPKLQQGRRRKQRDMTAGRLIDPTNWPCLRSSERHTSPKHPF